MHGLRSRKRQRELRDAASRRAEKEVRELLAHMGLEKDPLARIVARQIRRLEAAADRLEAKLNARGWFTKTGDPQPGVRTLIDITDRLLGEARR